MQISKLGLGVPAGLENASLDMFVKRIRNIENERLKRKESSGNKKEILTNLMKMQLKRL
jgi:hypothetical protein